MSTRSKKKSPRAGRAAGRDAVGGRSKTPRGRASLADEAAEAGDTGRVTSGPSDANAARVRAFLAERDTLISFDDLHEALVSRGMTLERAELGAVLVELEQHGEVIRNRRGAFGLTERMDLVRGKVLAHRDGYGFLVPDRGGDDVFLSPRQMRAIMHGDRALVSIIGYDNRGRSEGALIEVIERDVKRLVGTFEREAGVCYVVPDNSRLRHDILISEPPEAAPSELRAIDPQGIARGSIVVVEIDHYPTKRSPPTGRVIEVLGEHMVPGMEIDVAIRAYDLPSEFPDDALAESAALGEAVAEADKRDRVDLRHLLLVTIDGEDARDFDDAVYCEPRPSGWMLWVAIADVSAYVTQDSALDVEARRRGNSVYFPNRVLPMLPESLSNGLCSLRPDVDRLCMVCEMLIDRRGAITRSRFYEGLMRSRARLTYTTVAEVIEQRDPAARAALAELTPHLDELYALYAALRTAREARGALELDTVESYIIFDHDNRVSEIRARLRNDAHRLIEECMIAANVAAARFVQRQRLPALYRVHEGPKAERLEQLRAFLDSLDLRLGGGNNPQPEHFCALLEQVREDPRSPLVQTMLLRSLAQAVYRPDNLGHFGLGLKAYAHFTSPIRRYP
ncbi:MAG: ribonuclease R, partial [Gammaproteobacteria bacterium]|nr:ribonuclease R [Gammaproteobacteria bacterium]